MARLSAAFGHGTALLAACWIACVVACALAAWLGTRIARELSPAANTMLVALALLLAALELALLRPERAPDEPTRSFGAVVIVLVAGQATAATGFLVFVLAAATAAPWFAATGGALGGGGVLTAAWAMGGAWEVRLPLGVVRYAAAALLLVAALVTGLSAMGIL